MNLLEVFSIRYGQKEFHNKENLDSGGGLLISSQATDNGCYGFFDIEAKFKPPFITVPSTGSIGFAFVQLDEAGVADDALVLIPRRKYSVDYLFCVAYTIRHSRWRYNYGRKITPTRLATLQIKPPCDFKGRISYKTFSETLYPKKSNSKTATPKKKVTTRRFHITELFDLERGHFHAIDRLEKGAYPTISRVSEDNGLVGFYEKPAKAQVFSKGILTVSTVTGDAFLQLNPFIATDNVVMCIPKRPLCTSTLLYIQAMLNQIKWRYSYGRQCYKGNFQKTVITLPIKSTGELDEYYMESIITNQPYWNEFRERFLKNGQVH